MTFGQQQSNYAMLFLAFLVLVVVVVHPENDVRRCDNYKVDKHFN